ncbi:DEAD/DEAH box helicase [Bacillus sp. HMF5848]|uniref:DEAD/DEAH box helicase n=1 Tax=Bacillus sp. HMF5848 TaxID=2495421 RepID=UPI000F76651C|nr:DEAD/DEAH box helicase [Bacillus sp. HMF5848]RSK27609.1 DEAD/DEAH box helicase [Bacillus sp. HMF5848]
MEDIIGIFTRMKEMFIRYMDSPFALGHEKLMEERKEILEEEGNIYQYPYIEAMPNFKSSNKNVREACKSIGWSTDFGDFANRGLFNKDHNLHLHQYHAFEKVLIDKKNIVVTSGTGSGKTESFLLPLIANILEEAKKWDKPKEKEPSWWNLQNKWKPIRENEHRSAAIRGLVLYPLNALVEDQLVRLRKALDSEHAKNWLDQNRNGNRIYFGRYTGKTPVPGDPSDINKSKKLRGNFKQINRKQNELAEHFNRLIDSISNSPNNHLKQKLKIELQGDISGYQLKSTIWNQNDIQQIKGKLKEKYHEKLTYINQINGAELFSRWDMQEYPPDILITNFSMLNIILTRTIEQKMFEKTKKWLKEDSNNIFYLILDELHTYRGTAGTEVSYVIRALLNRIGLTPDSPQLRVLATSASLDETGKEFLEDFFGIPIEKFEIISGDREESNIFQKSESYKSSLDSFSKYYDISNLEYSHAVKYLCNEFGVSFDSENVDESLFQALDNSGILHEFLNVCTKPTSIKVLEKRIFGLNPSMKHIGGLLQAIIKSRKNGEVVIPLRTHLFFRNFQGLWACSNPNCSAVDVKYRYEGREIGKLYNQPKVQCNCGSRVLDFYYCQNCGDSFLGGYKSYDKEEGVFYLTADYPNLESLPDKVPFTKKYGEYALFWPSLDIDEDIKPWLRTYYDGSNTKRELQFSWSKVEYQPQLGKIVNDSYNNPNIHLYNIKGKKNQQDNVDTIQLNKMPAFPIKCPNCSDDWESKNPEIKKKEPLESTKRTRSPIRGQRTGFDMIAQVMLDSLMRELPSNETPKAVLFSDSRQDAAKLSAKIELNHYYHILRYIVVTAMNNQKNPMKSYIKQLKGESLTESESSEAEEYFYSNESQAMLIQAYLQGGFLPVNRKEQIKKLLESDNTPPKLMDLWNSIENGLVNLGVNPGGYENSVTENGGYKWIQLYDWSNMEHPSLKIEDLPNDLKLLRDDIMRSLRDNVLANVLFSQRKRDLESLCLAKITTDIDIILAEELGMSSDFWRQLVDSSIRILGGLRRYDLNRAPSDSPPSILKKYWNAVAKAHKLNDKEISLVATRIFENLKGVKDYLITSDELFVLPAKGMVYVCQKCGRNHLHASCNVCTDCYSPLVEKNLSEISLNDYYRYLTEDSKTYRRFHSEEMTGQTDSEVSSKRQQLFQAIYDSSDIPLVDEIDILSVTTTMEAGVDIGSLRMVAMSNMPPQRFNYQQRVGRCGRRGSALSVSLTLCRGRSHDDWYFDNLDKMTGDPPPQPYIDVKSKKIFSRVLFKEMLFHAFKDTGLIGKIDGGNSVHGEFGYKEDWVNYKEEIQTYFESREGKACLNEVVGCLSYQSKVSEGEKEELKEYIVSGKLVNEINMVSMDSKYSSNFLSENLASAGLLPMFGFPTRVKLFHHEKRSRYTPPHLLNSGTVDRDLEIAISEYSPGSEIIKDKAKHKSAGIAHYWIRGNQIVAEENPLGDIRKVALCRNCHILFDDESLFPDKCPSCESELGESTDYAFRSIPISEPQGFRSEWIKRDYKEDFEWSSRSSIPRLADDEKINENKKTIFNISYNSQEGNVYSINDNYGELFTFQKAKSSFDGWIEASTVGKDGFSPYLTDIRKSVALSSIKNTEVLLISPKQVSKGITFNPTNLGVKAGLISFGYLFRRVATSILDVDADELQVGIRSKVDNIQENTVGQIFLADTLINGAGYSKHLANSEILEEIMVDLTEEYSNIPKLKGHTCDSSCYECLRTYENMGYHPILDWRIGLDVAKLLKEPTFVPYIDIKWKRLVQNSIEGIMKNYQGTQHEWITGIPVLTLPFSDGKLSIIIVHPFVEKRDRKNFSDQLLEITTNLEIMGHKVLNYDIFDLIRRPTWVIMDAIEKKNNNDILIW